MVENLLGRVASLARRSRATHGIIIVRLVERPRRDGADDPALRIANAQGAGCFANGAGLLVADNDINHITSRHKEDACRMPTKAQL
jgi:hypothetical protein